MKTIYDALKEQGVCLSNGTKWLYFNGTNYVIYSRDYNQKKTRVLIETTDESLAVQYLLEE